MLTMCQEKYIAVTSSHSQGLRAEDPHDRGKFANDTWAHY